CVAGKRSSVNSTKQITRSWAANCGFWYDERDRSICVKGASRQRSDGSFRRNTNNQTNNSGMDSPILKSSVSVAVRSHADVELLGCRIVRLRSVRVPNHSPPAVGRHVCQAGDLHLEHEVVCPGRLTDGNRVDSKRGRRQSLERLFRMARRCLLNNQSITRIANKGCGDFVVS